MTTAEDKQVAFTTVWLETRTRDFWIGIATRPTTWLDSFKIFHSEMLKKC